MPTAPMDTNLGYYNKPDLGNSVLAVLEFTPSGEGWGLLIAY